MTLRAPNEKSCEIETHCIRQGMLFHENTTCIVQHAEILCMPGPWADQIVCKGILSGNRSFLTRSQTMPDRKTSDLKPESMEFDPLITKSQMDVFQLKFLPTLSLTAFCAVRCQCLRCQFAPVTDLKRPWEDPYMNSWKMVCHASQYLLVISSLAAWHFPTILSQYSIIVNLCQSLAAAPACHEFERIDPHNLHASQVWDGVDVPRSSWWSVAQITRPWRNVNQWAVRELICRLPFWFHRSERWGFRSWQEVQRAARISI